MLRNGGSYDILKRFRRLFDNISFNRRLFIIIILIGGFLLYFGSSLAQWFFFNNRTLPKAYEDNCIEERLASSYLDADVYDAAIIEHNIHNDESLTSTEHNNLLPYIGNGVFGVQVLPSNGRLYIKEGKTLSLYTQWDPLITVIPDNSVQRQFSVIQFTQGIVNEYQCIRDGYYVEHKYYAHQILNGIFIQEISISNPTSLPQKVALKLAENSQWTENESINIQVDGNNYKYIVTSSFVPLSNSDEKVAITIIYTTPPKSLTIKPKSTIKLEYLTSIYYSNKLQNLAQYDVERKNTEKKALKALKDALNIQQQRGLLNQHTSIWQSYWNTGFSISKSKAKGSLNGDKINSTIYYVLSQISKSIPNVEKSISNNEGCYRGHHTLNAPRLWKDISTIDDVNAIVKAWIITLENQGCHHLMTGGPSAVQQAIILSLGGLRFSNQHLEFNIDPQYLHRNYLFRRINYGNITHVNISVTVGNDNRAILSVALDRSDSDYYACDAGCLDSPVLLSQSYTNFPVKLTKPPTSILYITSDYQHMQNLRNALHVHAVEEAPAHDHHVMALHKHGHQLGGLPTFFWVSICFLIVVFHMFLCKLIFTEYYGRHDRQQRRYNKP
ncbi:uncharacterized protein KIAA2013 homolog [Chelonus insularis]|uniref:uncharacterized protein KIAA2013 homolog n=1 Tax=Chelonus insularis TaxID=460826 RepID=UPI00158DD050|nr:uncharacterized protein KIAA2013 homolog [Chelonus insularis]